MQMRAVRDICAIMLAVLLLALSLPAGLSAQSGEADPVRPPDMHSFLATTSTNAGRSANDVGFDCLAASALLDGGNEEARPRLAVALKEILSRASRMPDGSLQWHPNDNPAQEAKCGKGGWESFNTGRCNGPETVYTEQSGLGIACLALAGQAFGRKNLIREAKRSLRHWDTHRSRNIPGCDRCLYYWESDNANSVDRYVRNLNLFLGLADAAVGYVTDDETRLEDARAVARADIWERETGNAGYLGRLDPLWRERQGEDIRIENHAPSVALISEWIGRWAGFPEAQDHALAVWQQWATCSNKQCKVNGCHHWGADPGQCQETVTYAHCAFRRRSADSARLCQAILARDPSVPPYGIWAYATGADDPLP